MLNRCKKELYLLMVFTALFVAGRAYALTCGLSGESGTVKYLSVLCTCADGTVRFSSTDCSASGKCCYWTITQGKSGGCLVSTFCAGCLPI